MATRQLLSKADNIFVGNAYDPGVFEVTSSKGAPVSFLAKIDLGSPVAAVADALIKAATSTELPNNATKTYSAGDGVASPLDSASLPAVTTFSLAGGTITAWPLDVPRAVTAAGTHNSAFVTCTITITGYTIYKQKVVETLTLSGTTTASAAGKKAFKYITSIAITSAGNATTDTINIGWGDVLGLPYKLAAKSDLLGVWFNDTLDSSVTVVLADTSTVSATTGDTRGTVDPNSACDGSAVKLWMHVADVQTSAGLRGVTPYTG